MGENIGDVCHLFQVQPKPGGAVASWTAAAWRWSAGSDGADDRGDAAAAGAQDGRRRCQHLWYVCTLVNITGPFSLFALTFWWWCLFFTDLTYYVMAEKLWIRPHPTTTRCPFYGLFQCELSCLLPYWFSSSTYFGRLAIVCMWAHCGLRAKCAVNLDRNLKPIN